jgi:hypothetical protein
MRAAWFIGKFELLLNCTKYPNYSPKSRTPQQPQHVSSHLMTKKTLTILLIRASINSFSQIKLRGKFCGPFADLVGFCLDFKNDSLLEFRSWSCMDDTKALAKYKIDNKKLLLYFETEDSLKSTFTAYDTQCLDNDSISLTFLVKDKKTNDNLPLALVLIKSKLNDTIGARTDTNGIATLRVSKKLNEFEVHSTYIGCRKFEFKLNADKCKNITVNLVSTLDNPIEDGTKWEYEILKSNRHKLVLLRQNKSVKILRRYKK